MKLPVFINSLAGRIALFAMLLVVGGGLTRYILLAEYLREDLVQVVANQQLALADTIARDIDEKIEIRHRLLTGLAATLPIELLEHPAALRGWLRERQQLLPLFAVGLLVADRDGQIVADWPEVPGRVALQIAKEPGFRRVINGEFVIGSPRIGQLSKQALLPMGSPIRDTAGEVRGVLIGLSPLHGPGFLDRLQRERIGKDGGFLLISPQDRLFVAATDPAMVLQPTPAPGLNTLHDRAMAGFRGSGTTVNARGVEEISAIASVPSSGWFVVARLPTAEALASIERVQSYVIRHTVTAMLAVLIILVVMLRLMFRPLYSSADKAERMTRGELPLEPLPVVRDDEVGHLTTAFNRLLGKLLNSQSELERMANHDPLTGLPNRVLLADRCAQALARARRQGGRLAMLYLDLDGFKSINDQLGHQAGDDALHEVAQRLGNSLRQTDTLARIGGDEFVVLVEGLEGDGRAGAARLAEKCIAAVVPPLLINGTDCRLGVSIGIAIGDGEQGQQELLQLADHAMYAAKALGGNRYILALGSRDAEPPAER